MPVNLISRNTPDSQAEMNENGNLIMTTHAGLKGKYRWAQFDDYLHSLRRDVEWQKPWHMSLSARCDNAQHAGTWGFGLWNDPFNTNLGISGSVRRFPALPNCAWFFFASEHNYLSFHDHLPAQGFLAATFSSPLVPPFLLALSFPFLPLMLNKFFSRFARRTLGLFIPHDASLIHIHVNEWHKYQIDWLHKEVIFQVDDKPILTTFICPRGKLGLVIWVDNQYAAFPPDGNLIFGTLATNTSTTLEVADLLVK